jgi:hypothetical protein
MSNPTEKHPAGSEITEPRPPNCPYCEKPMPLVVLYPYQIGNLVIATTQCPHCATLLHTEFIRPQPDSKAPAPEPPKSGLWKPS